MPLSIMSGQRVPVKLWAPIHEVESGALTQLRNAANLPWAVHVLAMPDVHAGFGVPVGAVVALRDAVAPGLVGVDIGCGMCASRTALTSADLPKDLAELRQMVEDAIPVGTGCAHDEPLPRPPWMKQKEWDELWKGVSEAKRGKCELLTARKQLGTLGSGNHFIEVCLDLKDRVWLMLHSGSRNLGKEICDGYAKKATQLEHNRALPDKQLSVFLRGSPEFADYWRDMKVAQWYAEINRAMMMDLLVGAMADACGRAAFDGDVYVNCHHNYADEEEVGGERLIVARKGAIRVGTGLGIIPGAMGRKSFIVRGLGNHDALLSASHGAGRVMSRGEANRRFTVDDLRESTKGVECHVGKGVLDEIAEAYKDIEAVMANQADLVQPEHELRAVLCVKGHDDAKKRQRRAAEKERDQDRREARKMKGKR